jgi:uncharacterized protein (TIGR00297 family)
MLDRDISMHVGRVTSLIEQFAEPLPRSVVGFLAAMLVSLLAYFAKSLSMSGVVAATFVGGAIVAGAGWWTGGILIAYFISSSLLSSAAATRHGVVEQARGKRRDALQVLANGGVPAFCALCVLISPDETIPQLACLATIAAATSDTWASEIGRFSAQPPRLLTTWRVVPAGTSGAVSPVGTLGGVAGAALIATLALPGGDFDSASTSRWTLDVFFIVFTAGVAGLVADSLLGATVQERRWCPVCRQPTEQRRHRCDTPTIHQGGWEWLTNDAVNGVSVAVGGLVSLGLAIALIG